MDFLREGMIIWTEYFRRVQDIWALSSCYRNSGRFTISWVRKKGMMERCGNVLRSWRSQKLRSSKIISRVLFCIVRWRYTRRIDAILKRCLLCRDDQSLGDGISIYGQEKETWLTWLTKRFRIQSDLRDSKIIWTRCIFDLIWTTDFSNMKIKEFRWIERITFLLNKLFCVAVLSMLLDWIAAILQYDSNVSFQEQEMSWLSWRRSFSLLLENYISSFSRWLQDADIHYQWRRRVRRVVIWFRNLNLLQRLMWEKSFQGHTMSNRNCSEFQTLRSE